MSKEKVTNNKKKMGLREIIFSQLEPQKARALWDAIQFKIGGQRVYIPKIDVKEVEYRDNLIRELFFSNKQTIPELAKNFTLCKMRIRQIVFQKKYKKKRKKR